jgi:hypothetical protein
MAVATTADPLQVVAAISFAQHSCFGLPVASAFKPTLPFIEIQAHSVPRSLVSAFPMSGRALSGDIHRM